MNIEGLSQATLEKFIARGFVKDFTDLFHLERYAEEIKQMEGFGEKSYDNLMRSIEQARQTTLPKLLYSLGIPNIGLSNAKMICRAFDEQPERLINASEEELSAISGIGGVIAHVFVEYFLEEENRELFRRLLAEVELPEMKEETEKQIFEDMNFVVTGAVTHFANRREIKELIEKKGGKVTGTVTSKTNYLINNDVDSTSSKNKKAKDLGIPVISEEDFLKMLEE